MAIVSINHSVGKNSINHPDDVRKVSDLLTKVGFWKPVMSLASRIALSASGTLKKQEIPKELISAIEQWDTTPDGIIGPTGSTLGMLNRLTGGANKLVDGGFKIGYKGAGRKTYRMPRKFKMLLQVSFLGHSILTRG